MTNEDLFFDALKSHRESKDIEISEICEFTKISPRYIEAIESGDFSILPTVYMRLFLRAYADFIGADSTKALEDLALHTTGKIQKRTDFEIKLTEDTDNLGEMKETMESATSQVSPKQIATGAAVIIGLFLVLYWAGQITSQQQSVVEKETEPIEAIEPIEVTAPVEAVPQEEPEVVPIEEPEEVLEEKKSPVIDAAATVAADIPPEVVEEKPASLPNRLPLNANDFLLENRTRQTTNIVKLYKPYTITVLTLADTKLNISKSNEGKLAELINAAAPAGEIFQFDFESTINFEFWNSAHVRVKLNEIPLDTFFPNTECSCIHLSLHPSRYGHARCSPRYRKTNYALPHA